MKKTLISSILLLVVLAAVLVGAAACNGETDGFVYATDLVDGAVIDNADYCFKASASYNGEQATIQITCNGVLATQTEQGYLVRLNQGANQIVLTAKSQGQAEKRTFSVTYRRDFSISTDVESSPVVNGVISSHAAATYNDQACSFVVKHNGNSISGNADGSFTATLQVGNNDFQVIARHGDDSLQKSFTVNCGTFSLVTDLKDVTTQQPTHSFMAVGKFNGESCNVVATVNGTELQQQDGKYTFQMPRGGDYVVKVVASSGVQSYFQTYTVRFIDAPPQITSISLTDGAVYYGSVCSFEIIAKDALGNKVDDTDLSFAVDFDAANGVDEFVPLAWPSIYLVWSDQEKTSYRFDFTKEQFGGCKSKQLLFKVTVSSPCGDTTQVFAMTYVGAQQDGKIGSVVFSIEAFTIGCGYLVAPTVVDVYEGENFATRLDEILTERGLTYSSTGTLQSGFYLASVKGFNLTGNKIPTSLMQELNKHNARVFTDTIGTDDDGKYDLGEFDYASGSGWMYSVNGSFPNYGFADYYPQNNDVVRVCFTLALGSDVGGGWAMGDGTGGNYCNFANYAKVHALLAKVAANDYYGKSTDVYNAAISAVSMWNATQQIVDEQVGLLTQEYLPSGN